MGASHAGTSWRASALVVLVASGLLGGCQRKPDFDERYAKAQEHIEQSSKAIDARLAGGSVPTDGASHDLESVRH